MGIETAVGIQGFGAGMSAMGAYSQAKGQKAALKAESQVQANNATLAEWQAEDAIARGETAAVQVQQQGAQMLGRQRASMAANGVDLSYGSAMQVINDTDYLTAVDASQTMANASREAWGYRMEARQMADRSRAASAGASQISPWLAAGTSLLGSATQAASRWYSSGGSSGTRDGFGDWAFRSNRRTGD